MKQLGNLAVVCAKRHDTLMQVLNGTVTIHIGHGLGKTAILMDWHDDEKIRELVFELNHGQFAEKTLTEEESHYAA